jgi:TonB family protein
MDHNKGMVFLFAYLFLANTGWCAGQEEAASPEALISQARLEEAIWTEGTPPMSMRAEVQVANAHGALVHGDYALDWVSPSQWREEIRFEKQYERLRVRNAKGYWQKSGLSYQPESIFQLDAILRVKDLLKIGPKQALGKVRNREKAGVREKCTEVRSAKGIDRIMCFDDTNGTLASVEYPTGENQNPPEISRIEYGAFRAVGAKLVPYEIRALKDRKVIAIVEVLEIGKISEESPSTFNVPTNADFWPQCDDPQLAELINRVQPAYPAKARANHEQGRVIFYAVIETDGSLSHTTIIRRADLDLEAAAVEALRHWHYKPAACGQTPIRVETSLAIDFWLEGGRF